MGIGGPVKDGLDLVDRPPGDFSSIDFAVVIGIVVKKPLLPGVIVNPHNQKISGGSVPNVFVTSSFARSPFGD